eukprot:2016621-Rhodomonas_salina.1
MGRSHPGAIPDGYLRGHLTQVRAWTFDTTPPHLLEASSGLSEAALYGGASCTEARAQGGETELQ